jgi:hypothetical protein
MIGNRERDVSELVWVCPVSWIEEPRALPRSPLITGD